MQISDNLLKEIRQLANDSITIMDENGRSNEDNNCRVLFNEQWQELRNKILRIEEWIDQFGNK